MAVLAATLCLLAALHGACASRVFKMEAENLPGSHSESWRGAASGLKTVKIGDTSTRLTFQMCLYTDVTADVTVVYSNDGVGAEDVTMDVDGSEIGSFPTVAESDGSSLWNVFRRHSFTKVSLKRGLRRLSLTFPVLDGEVEIDVIEVKVYDDFINEQVFRCNLVLGAEPSFAATQAPGMGNGYVAQNSYVTPCAEEDNVHLSVYHDSVTKYTIKATHPLYRSFFDKKLPDTSSCPNLGANYWRFAVIGNTNIGTTSSASDPADNHNNATVTGEMVNNDPTYTRKFTVQFSLKGFKTGFVDADIHSVLEMDFQSVPMSGVSAKVTYKGKGDGTETVLGTFDVSSDVKKKWEIPEMTWSEDYSNYIYIYISDDVLLRDMKLVRGTMTEVKEELYKSDAVILEGARLNFWWRRPAGESLTVEVVQGQTFTGLSFLTVYVPVPWGGPNNWQQIFVLYQDGNVRLLPLPYSSPTPGFWNPFGTSVIVGKSNPDDLRPAAGINRLVFDPKTFKMSLNYYDKSTCDMTLTYGVQETMLSVDNLVFPSATSGQPFAAFRSMFVDFGNTDSDSVQSDVDGPKHVLGAWKRMEGKEFKLFRSVESHHLTQSPDISLKIEQNN